jgi:ATP-binding cassette subfamily B protein
MPGATPDPTFPDIRGSSKETAMAMLSIYLRVLGQLGPEKRLGVYLALANLFLAVAAFAEPVLFGKIIDVLTRSAGTGAKPTWPELMPLMLGWVGFGIFTILAGVYVALHADRLAHRRRLAVMANYFEHALTLPIAFHTATHSGRVLKVMLDGTSGMWGLWLSFFREHCASIVALFVLLPFTMWLNWQMGLLLVVLVVFFGALTAFVLRKTEKLQGSVERFLVSQGAAVGVGVAVGVGRSSLTEKLPERHPEAVGPIGIGSLFSGCHQHGNPFGGPFSGPIGDHGALSMISTY